MILLAFSMINMALKTSVWLKLHPIGIPWEKLVTILSLIALLHTYNHLRPPPPRIVSVLSKRNGCDVTLTWKWFMVERVSGSSQTLGTSGQKPDSVQGHLDTE